MPGEPSEGTPPAPRGPRPGTVAVTALGAVAVGLLLFLIVVRLAGSSGAGGGRQASKSTREFDVGSAKDRASTIRRDRTPLLFPDPAGNGRAIYVQHLGDTSWAAFEARPPGADERCSVRWRVESQHFVDPCTGSTYPADGTGLVSYPTRIDEGGHLLVDLRAPRQPAPR